MPTLTAAKKTTTRKKLHAVPDECGFLADVIFDLMKTTEQTGMSPDLDPTSLAEDMRIAAEWLDELPPDVSLADIDLLKEHSWGKEAVAKIKAFRKAYRKSVSE